MTFDDVRFCTTLIWYPKRGYHQIAKRADRDLCFPKEIFWRINYNLSRKWNRGRDPITVIRETIEDPLEEGYSHDKIENRG